MHTFKDYIKKLTIPQAFYWLLLVVVLWVAGRMFTPYLGPIIWAGVFAITLQPVYTFFSRRMKSQPDLLALIATWITFFSILIGSLSLVIWTIFITIRGIPIDQVLTQDWQTFVSDYIEQTSARFQVADLLRDAQLEERIESQVQNSLRQISLTTFNIVQDLFSSTADFVIKLIIWFFFVSAFLTRGPQLKAALFHRLPLDRHLTDLLWLRTKRMVESVMLGAVVISLAQALVGGIFLILFQVPSALALTILMALLGIIPYIGGGLIMLIGVAILALQNQIPQAILLFILSVGVVGNIDNVLRPKVVRKEAAIPESFMLLAIVAGVGSFGISGLIYGPVLMIWLKTLIEVSPKYYQP